MKRILFFAMALIGFNVATFAQAAPAVKKQPAKVIKTKPSAAQTATPAAPATPPKAATPAAPAKPAAPAVKASAGNSPNPSVRLKKDGTPDKRYKANQHLKKDGTPDKRFKENKKG